MLSGRRLLAVDHSWSAELVDQHAQPTRKIPGVGASGIHSMSLIDTILGRPLASNEAGEQRIGPAAGIPTFGLDALSSAAYGPEAALTVLLPLGAAGLTQKARQAKDCVLSSLLVALLLIERAVGNTRPLRQDFQKFTTDA
jgi:hypothetical protein